VKTWAKIKGGYIVAIANAARQPLGEWVELPEGAWPGWQARPSPSHKPRRIGNLVAWEDPRTLEQAREQRLAQIQAERDAVLFGGFQWDGSTFDSNADSQSRLMGLRVDAMLPTFTPRGWRLADNTWRTLSAADAAGIWVALTEHMEGQFRRFEAREAAINAATTVAAVDAVTWE
jgi:hypothetical protein